MALQSERNFQLTGGTTTQRGSQFIVKLKEVLATAGWTLIGYGDGVSGSGFNLTGVTTTFPSFPSYTGMDAGAWLAVENVDGIQIVCQHVSGSTFEFYASVGGGYTDDGVGHSTRVGNTTPPADEMAFVHFIDDFGSEANQYMSIIYDDTATSFVVFGQYGGADNISLFCLKLTGAKAGDPAPYIFKAAGGSADTWDVVDLQTSVYGWHPSAARETYKFLTIEGASNIMDNMPADPVSGAEQLVDCIVGCDSLGSVHLRGVAPIVKWMSGLRSTGDTFESNQYMGIGRVALDGWNSADPLSS